MCSSTNIHTHAQTHTVAHTTHTHTHTYTHPHTMDSIIAAINDLRASSSLDETSRLKLQDALRGAADALETPNDTMLRLFNAVSKYPSDESCKL